MDVQNSHRPERPRLRAALRLVSERLLRRTERWMSGTPPRALAGAAGPLRVVLVLPGRPTAKGITEQA
jgi:hypothetical protein